MKKSIYLILDNIRSLYNIGSMFRTADAFGIEKIYLCGISAYPPNRQMEKIVKTSLGAEKIVPWEYHKQALRLIKDLKSHGVKIIALENNVGAYCNTPLQKYKPTYPLVLIVGNEVKGINQNILKIADRIIYIPMSGKKESLNVAVACAIAMYFHSAFKSG